MGQYPQQPPPGWNQPQGPSGPSGASGPPGPYGPPRPYGPFPPPVWSPPPWQPGYGPMSTDGKATTSLVLGVLSILCFGIFSGLPAVIVGAMSRRDIARSNNSLGGGGAALGGIITGAIGSFMSLVTFGFLLFGIFAAARAPSTPYVPPAPTSFAPYTPPSVKHGTTEVLDLHPSSGSLQAQLLAANTAAGDNGQTVLVEITARWCGMPCEAVKSELSYAAPMQSALAHVRLLRVDADEFATDLMTLGMSTQRGLPVFYKVDATGRATDSLSANEWGDDTAENMAPVLAAFVLGTPRPMTRGAVRPSADAGAPVDRHPSRSPTLNAKRDAGILL